MRWVVDGRLMAMDLLQREDDGGEAEAEDGQTMIHRGKDGRWEMGAEQSKGARASYKNKGIS